MIMHVQVNGEILNGLRMMKFAVNHWWKLKFHRVAFLTGYLQVLAMVCITIVNYFVIMISNNVIDIAKDFTALMIIAEFDDIFGKTSIESRALKIIEDVGKYELLFRIETTTSDKARRLQNRPLDKDPVYEKMKRTAEESGNKEYPDFKKYPRKRPENMHIDFFERSFENACFYMIYKLWRLFHVSLWFYFFPFIVLIITYAWPQYMLRKGSITEIIEQQEALLE